MIPIYTLNREHIDYLIGRLNKDIGYFERAIHQSNPRNITKGQIDHAKCVRNKLTKAINRNKYKEATERTKGELL